MAVASDANIGVGGNIIKTTSLLSIISFGDIEAILSAFGFAIGVLFLSKLVLKHSSIEVAAASMFTSGLILVGFMIIGLLSYESNHIALPSNEVRLLAATVNKSYHYLTLILITSTYWFFVIFYWLKYDRCIPYSNNRIFQYSHHDHDTNDVKGIQHC